MACPVRGRPFLLLTIQCPADMVAGSILYRTFTHLGHPEDLIKVHHLTKGTNLHTDVERANLESYGTDKVVVLDQGSRPGRSLVDAKDPESKRVLIIDHHMSDEVSISISSPPIHQIPLA